jgi:hypothetical protein
MINMSSSGIITDLSNQSDLKDCGKFLTHSQRVKILHLAFEKERFVPDGTQGM